MQYLREAAQDVQRNLSALLIFVAIFGVTQIVTTFVTFPFEPADAASQGRMPLALDIAILLVFVHVIAFAQTIAFSRLGREIDKPLWKVRTDGDALKRFFMMWALMNLTANGFLRVGNMDFGGGDAAAINVMLSFMALGAFILIIPVGACVMFTGHASSRNLGEALAPLSRQPARTGTVLLIMIVEQFTVFFFFSAMVGPEGQMPPLLVRLGFEMASGIVQVYLECLAFAATWHLCMVDRETVDEIDLDF